MSTLQRSSRRTAALDRKSALYTLDVVRSLQTIERDLGGRTALVGLLALAPLTPDLRYVLGLLGDPTHQSVSLAEICARGNILPGDLLKHLATAALARGKLLAAQRIGDGIAAVADDIMRRAAPYEAPCNGGCQGTGAITQDPSPAEPNPKPELCEVCRGTGKLVYSPDLERQKLAVEMAQLLPKSGGIQIAQINTPATSGGAGGTGPLESMQRLTDQLLYGHGASGGQEQEGEIVEGSAPATTAEQPAAPPEAGGGPDGTPAG